MTPYVVIMAGGSGERFWPWSRKQHPKQLLRLTSPSLTMLDEAIQRIAPLVPAERILVITSEVLREAIIAGVPALPPANVIAEPAKRNTAPCLALAAAVIDAREFGKGANGATMAVLTADHFIGDVDAFRENVTTALAAAEHDAVLVTLGIRPTRPETGYGYIEVAAHSTLDAGRPMKVMSFREKPERDVALDYVVSGRYLWNSGMFFWSTESLNAAMMKSLPVVGTAHHTMRDAILAGNFHTAATSQGITESVRSTFESLPDVSIDYGVMEQAENVVVVPATFPWDDVGSWDAMDRLREQDESMNVIQGDVYTIDTSSSIIVNTRDDGHVVTTLGMENVVVVSTQDATMICSKDRAQDVKKLVTLLRESGREDVI